MVLQFASPGQEDHTSTFVSRDSDGSGVGSSNLSPAAVGGITAGGVVGLFIVLILIARFTAQKRYGDEKGDRRLSAFSIDDDVRRAMHSAHPPVLDLSQRTHPYSNYTSRKLSSVTDFWHDDSLHGLQTSTSKLIRPSRSFFRTSRDSWPLISWSKSPTTPVSITHPSNQTLGESIIRPSSSPTIHKSPPLPVIPTRSYSQPGLSTELSLGFERGALANTMGRVGRESMRPTHLKQKSASDNQLTSILRSTSQRLRDREAGKNGRPLSRAMSSLSQTSGAPPTQKLPSPPLAKNTESREGLMAEYRMQRPESAASNVVSISGSLFELYPIERTPSPDKPMPWSADDVGARPISPAQSNVSDDDSLYRPNTPDMIAPLSSPGQKISSSEGQVFHGFNEGGTMMHKDNCASEVAMNGKDIFPFNRHHHSDNRTNSREPPDSFFSTSYNLTGPREASRPSYARKANLGEQSKVPLASVSGNNIAHPAGPRDKSTQHNPFQWSPEEARRQKPLQVVQKQPVRRGHKRQNVVRMSGLPRPPSVTMIPEQPEDTTPDRLMKSTSELAPPAARFIDHTDSPTSVYSRFTLTRPPSVKEFDPTLSLPDLSGDPGHQAVFPLPPYSSTLSIYEYYSSPESNKSEEDLVTDTPNMTPSQAKRRHGRDFSVENFVFNPPAVDESRPGTATSSHSQNLIEALHTRDSIQASIALLRRMNSEVSTYSLASSRNSNDSIVEQDYQGGDSSPSKTSRNRGSKHYLAMGDNTTQSSGLTLSPARKKMRSRGSEMEPSPTRQPGVSGQGLGSRQSSDLAASLNMDMGLRIQGLPEIPVKDKRRSLRSEEIAELLRLYTSSYTDSQLGGETPRIGVGDWEGQEVAQKIDNGRWEQTQPAAMEGTRHESQLKMPSPQGRIKWDGMKAESLQRTETRESLGLYDEDGFLRNSPGRENRV